jgi:citrate lyase synthetase
MTQLIHTEYTKQITNLYMHTKAIKTAQYMFRDEM